MAQYLSETLRYLSGVLSYVEESPGLHSSVPGWGVGGNQQHAFNFASQPVRVIHHVNTDKSKIFTFSLWVDPACLVVSAYTISEGCSS